MQDGESGVVHKDCLLKTGAGRAQMSRDGTRKLSEISDRKFSGNFRKEISIPFRNHSIFLLLYQYILEMCLIRPGLAGNAGYFMPLEIAKRSG